VVTETAQRAPLFRVAKKLALAAVLLGFLVKCVVIGLFVLPAWDGPDEPGHFSSIKFLSEGKGYPRLGESYKDEEVVEDILPGGGNSINYIAQHPPLYYLSAVLPYRLGIWVGDGWKSGLYSVRVYSALCSTVLLWLLYLIVRQVSGNEWLGLSAVMVVSAIPMFSYMGAVASNDPLLGTLVMAAFWCWIKFLNTDRPVFLYWFSVFLGAAFLTKYTALAMAVPWWAMTLLWMPKHWTPRIKRMLISGVIMGLPIGLWMLRNQLLYGALLPLYSKPILDTPMTMSFVEFLKEFKVPYRVYAHFLGLMGFAGKVQEYGEARLFIINPLYQGYLTMFFLVLTTIGLLGKAAEFWRLDKKQLYVWMLTSAAILLWFIMFVRVPVKSVWTQTLFTVLCVWLGYISTLVFHLKSGLMARNTIFPLQAVCMVIVVFFAFMLLSKMYHSTIYSGFLRGAHGRYYFPLFGAVFIGFLVPGLRVIKPYAPWLFAASGVLLLNEFFFWAEQAIEFFHG